MPGTVKLLLVDDSDEQTRAVVDALEHAGFTAVWQQVRTEQELDAAMRDRWDVVLSSDRLSHLTGRRALDLCQQHDSAVPFVFLCADPDWEWTVDVMRAGAGHCVPKSDLSRLPQVVAHELDAAERRRHGRAASGEAAAGNRYERVFQTAPVALLELDLSRIRRFFVDPHDVEPLGNAPSDGAPSDGGPSPSDDVVLRAAVRRVRVRSANRAALQLLQAPAAGGVDVARLVAAESASVWCGLLRALREAGAGVQREISIGTMNGGSVDALIAFQVPCSAAGFSSVVIGLVDLRARKLAERRTLIAERAHAAGRLAGTVAHDFNNTLTIIKGYAGLLLDTAADEDPIRNDLRAIEDAAETAEALTRRLLAFGRNRRPDPRVFRIDETLHGLRTSLQRALGDDVELSIVLPESLWPVEMDPSHFEEVLMELAANAREAMPTGGALVIEAANTRANTVAAGEAAGIAGDFVTLSVRDSGCGMDEDVRGQVFEPGFTTRSDGRGAGLGLPIVYGIVRQAGGVIDVRSTPGEGTVFEILLPRHAG